MKKSSLSLIVSFLSTLAFSQHDSIYQKLNLCKLPGIDDSVLCGSYPVFENRQTKQGRMIPLNIVVIPAIHRDSTGAPIFYLEGGPGIGATQNAAFFADRTNVYRQYHDIVLVDIRGTGNSNPLSCPSLQIRKTLKEQLNDMYPETLVKECYQQLSKIADLKQYNTVNAVDDLDDIREWLGYETINLFGLSYGTRVALVYMNLYPSSIQSSVLWSPLSTYSRMPLYHALFAQQSLQLLFQDCDKDFKCHSSFPALDYEFKLLMEKAKATPFQYTFTNGSGQKEKISIPWNAFQTKLRTLMYTPEGMRQIPFIIHQAYKGNLEPFINLYPKGSDTSFLAEGFYLSVTCTEDVPFIRDKEVDALTRGTFMGRYRVDQQKRACANWVRGEIPPDYFKAIKSDIPTLIISGSLDPVTPTSMAKEIAGHLSRSRLVVIPEMAHLFDGLSNAEYFDYLCVGFLNNPENPKLNMDAVRFMKPGPFRIK